jgi:hypothetical protein
MVSNPKSPNSAPNFQTPKTLIQTWIQDYFKPQMNPNSAPNFRPQNPISDPKFQTPETLFQTP